jgi:hypothetical protein
MRPLRIVPNKGSFVHKVSICDLCESSQVKGPLFTKYLCDLCELFKVNSHLFTRCLCVDTLWTKILYLGRFARVSLILCEQRTLYLGRFAKVTYRHLVNKGPFIWDDSKGSFVQKVYICDLCESSQVKGPLFTKYQWYPGKSSQANSHLFTKYLGDLCE